MNQCSLIDRVNHYCKKCHRDGIDIRMIKKCRCRSRKFCNFTLFMHGINFSSIPFSLEETDNLIGCRYELSFVLLRLLADIEKNWSSIPRVSAVKIHCVICTQLKSS